MILKIQAAESRATQFRARATTLRAVHIHNKRNAHLSYNLCECKIQIFHFSTDHLASSRERMMSLIHWPTEDCSENTGIHHFCDHGLSRFQWYDYFYCLAKQKKIKRQKQKRKKAKKRQKRGKNKEKAKKKKSKNKKKSVCRVSALCPARHFCA